MVFKLSMALSNLGKMTKTVKIKWKIVKNDVFFFKVVQFPVCYPSAAALETIFLLYRTSWKKSEK